MRTWLAIALLAGCGGRARPVPVDDRCASTAPSIERAKVDARHGRILHARARLRGLGACFDGEARRYAEELHASLGIDALVAKRNVTDPAAEAAAAKGDAALARARGHRAALGEGALDAGDAMDAAYAEAAAAYEHAVAQAPRLAWLVTIAELWREADLRVEANRAASRAAAFAMAVAGVEALTPELVPARTADPDAMVVFPLYDEPSSVQRLTWSTDGAVLFAAPYGGVLRAWQPGREVRASRGDDLAARLDVTTIGRPVIEIDHGKIHVREHEGATVHATIIARDVEPAYPAVRSPDGTAVLTGTHAGLGLALWQPDGAHRALVSLDASPSALDWGAAGIVVGGGWRDDAGRVRCYDPDGTLRWQTEATGDPVMAIATDPEGRRIAVGTRHGAIRIYDRDGALRGTLVAADDRAEAAPTSMFEARDPRLALDWLAVDVDGHVDGSPGGHRFVQWRAGDQVVPGFIGWDAQVQPQVLDRVLAR